MCTYTTISIKIFHEKTRKLDTEEKQLIYFIFLKKHVIILMF